MAQTDEKLAGRGTRLVAILLDSVFGLVVLIPGWAAFINAADSYPSGGEGDALILLALSFLGFVSVQIYLLTKRGQTVGKMLVGIQIVDVGDETLVDSMRVVGLRGVLPGLIVTIPYIGGFFALADVLFIFGKRRRCLHDHFASTKVIQSKKADESTGNAIDSLTETTSQESLTQTKVQTRSHNGLEKHQNSDGFVSTVDGEAPMESLMGTSPDKDSPDNPGIDQNADPYPLRDILKQDHTWSAKRRDFLQALPNGPEEFFKGEADLRDMRTTELGKLNTDQTEDKKGTVSARQGEKTEGPMRATEQAKPGQKPKERTNTLVCDTYLEWCHSAGVMVGRYYMFERRLGKKIDDVSVRPIYRDKRANGIRLRYNVDDISDEFWLVEAGPYRAVFPQPRDGNHFRTLAPLFETSGASNPKSLSVVEPADVDPDGTSYQLKSRGMVK